MRAAEAQNEYDVSAVARLVGLHVSPADVDLLSRTMSHLKEVLAPLQAADLEAAAILLAPHPGDLW